MKNGSDTEAPLLQVRKLRKEYATPGEPLVALDGVGFNLGAAESLAIMGPSGSGKSTLLHMIGALDTPTSGTITLGGVDPFTLSPAAQAAFRNEKIGFVFQDHCLLPQCSALENVLIPALARGRAAEGAEARARELLDRVGLGGRLDHRPAELSGGERQRVAVARAMINRPALLLGDEPTGNLDSKNSDAVAEIFRRLQSEEKTAIVVVTHSAAFAARFDRQAAISDGRFAPKDAE